MPTHSLPSRSSSRQEARARLSGNWGKAILVRLNRPRDLSFF